MINKAGLLHISLCHLLSRVRLLRLLRLRRSPSLRNLGPDSPAELRNTLSARFAPSTLRQACVTPASRRLSSIPRRYKIRSHSLQKWIPFVTMIPFLRLDYVSDLIYLWCGFSSQEPSGRTRRRPMTMFLDHERLVDCTILESVQIVIQMITVPPRCTRRTRVVTSQRRTILPSRGS